jgi:hypothetical protein
MHLSRRYHRSPGFQLRRSCPSHPVIVSLSSRTMWGKLVEVRTFNGHKATQLGGSRPESIARLLLHELAKEGKA